MIILNDGIELNDIDKSIFSSNFDWVSKAEIEEV
jgi:hypothetical protein